MDLLEIHIRTTLEQTDFIYPEKMTVIDDDGRESCYEPEHLRIDFDSQDDLSSDNENRLLLELFNTDFKRFRVVLKSCKGHIHAIIVSLYNYDRRNYWELSYGNIPPQHNGDYPKGEIPLGYPYILHIDDLNNYGTVGIIRFLIEKIIELDSHNIPLDVPFKSKSDAKSLGAYWNPNEKLWFIPFACKKENRMLLLDKFEIKILQ